MILLSRLRRAVWTAAVFSLFAPSVFAQVFDNIESAKSDPDFMVQGEYVSDTQGLQVIARGDGEFDLVLFEGGLPGAGGDTTAPRRLEGDADVVADLVEAMELEKVQRKSPTLGAKPPHGATVLFDGTKKSIDQHWRNGKLVAPNLLGVGTTTNETFGDYRLHLEFKTPFMPTATGQGRGNSGVYHQGRYETQVLDSFGLEGKDNEAGGIYTVSPPSVNMCFPPLSWQTYDVDFTAARFDDQGNKTSDARMTVRLNGVIVQNNVVIPEATKGAPLKESAAPGPIHLQNHGNPVRYRNIWIVPVDTKREARRPIVAGFERFYASSSEPDAIAGELLINALACDACHAADSFADLSTKRGPDLSAVAGRVRVDAMVDMIADPHQFKPGTTMPDPWGDLSVQERRQQAQAITSFLVTKGERGLRDRSAPKDLIKTGRRLYQTVGCVACHAADPKSSKESMASTSVPLAGVEKKYTLTSLAEFLRQPHVTRPGSRMPGLVGTEKEAAAIAAYLLGDTVVQSGVGKFTRRIYRGDWNRLPDFSNRKPEKTDDVFGVKIDDIKPKLRYAVIFDATLKIEKAGEYTFRVQSDDGSRLSVDGTEIAENDGIHPVTTATGSIKLSKGLHSLTLQYLQKAGEAELRLEYDDPEFGWTPVEFMVVDPENPVSLDFLPSQYVPDPSLADAGQQLFRSVGCANCHAFTGTSASLVAKPLNQLDVNRGCLANDVPAGSQGVVDFELNHSQRAAITAAIKQRKQSGVPTVDDATRVHVTMAAMNCYACHKRGTVGGPESIREAAFTGTTPEMGLEGQVPPPLDGVGDKLTDAYMKTILQHGANERPYMRTRMPAFRYEHLKAMHESINRLDRKGDDHPIATEPASENQIAAGRQCVGNRGLACIKCHSYNGNKGGGIGAIDMLKMTTRLRPEWFHRYLLDPPLYRPGTRMPKSFVDGESPLADLYGGDPDKQIDAIWKYLLQGDKAKEPEGLTQGAILLAASAKPLIYRNFFTDVSARGIGVAYPGEVNLIWDAEQMSLAKLWKNSFVDASLHWVARGKGRQQPLGDAVVWIDKAVPLAILPTMDAAWPSESARELGYKFKGYTLDANGVPTFRYEVDGYSIQDKPVAKNVEGVRSLERQFTVTKTADSAETMVMRFATGAVKSSDGGTITLANGVRMTIEGVSVQQVGNADATELRAVIPPGESVSFTRTIHW
ncbi:family 16 glycoside hydrolase [Novipirellula caenicola]|uniref:family 16 glycoside hydrolase n=1 Tax=Novipirellula caenicola TaxID=1536901 RepID=UPI0031EA142A